MDSVTELYDISMTRYYDCTIMEFVETIKLTIMFTDKQYVG